MDSDAAQESEPEDELLPQAGGVAPLVGDDDSEDDSEPEDELLPQACLPVGGAPMPPSEEPPQTADEYLRQVQWERMHCADIVDVEVEEKPPRRHKKRGMYSRDGSLISGLRSADVPEAARSCPEWEEDSVVAFRRLRDHCQQLRASMEGSSAGGKGRLSFADWREKLAQERPTAELLAGADFVSTNHLVVVAVESFSAACCAAEASGEDADAGDMQVSPASGLPSPLLTEWVFATLLFVEEPLVDDTQYQLQQLRRLCQKLICKTHAGAGASADGSACASASLILSVVEGFFKQR